MTITEFIEARLTEIEAAARESYYEGQRWLTEEEGVYTWPGDELVHIADRKADARHIARHDPARVLREIEFKRAIIALHHEDAAECMGCYDGRDGFAPYPCQTIRRLAAIDSDHPGYDPSWAPNPT